MGKETEQSKPLETTQLLERLMIVEGIVDFAPVYSPEALERETQRYLGMTFHSEEELRAYSDRLEWQILEVADGNVRNFLATRALQKRLAQLPTFYSNLDKANLARDGLAESVSEIMEYLWKAVYEEGYRLDEDLTLMEDIGNFPREKLRTRLKACKTDYNKKLKSVMVSTILSSNDYKSLDLQLELIRENEDDKEKPKKRWHRKKEEKSLEDTSEIEIFLKKLDNHYGIVRFKVPDFVRDGVNRTKESPSYAPYFDILMKIIFAIPEMINKKVTGLEKTLLDLNSQ